MGIFCKEIDQPLTEDQQKFINETDFDLNVDTWEESMFNDMTFTEFLNFKNKHYGKLIFTYTVCFNSIDFNTSYKTITKDPIKE